MFKFLLLLCTNYSSNLVFNFKFSFSFVFVRHLPSESWQIVVSKFLIDRALNIQLDSGILHCQSTNHVGEHDWTKSQPPDMQNLPLRTGDIMHDVLFHSLTYNTSGYTRFSAFVLFFLLKHSN